MKIILIIAFIGIRFWAFDQVQLFYPQICEVSNIESKNKMISVDSIIVLKFENETIQYELNVLASCVIQNDSMFVVHSYIFEIDSLVKVNSKIYKVHKVLKDKNIISQDTLIENGKMVFDGTVTTQVFLCYDKLKKKCVNLTDVHMFFSQWCAETKKTKKCN